MIDLTEILVYGTFHSLNIGCELNKVLGELGSPDETKHLEFSDSTIYFYDEVQLTIYQSKLISLTININHFNSFLFKKRKVEFDSLLLNNFIKILSDSNIKWEFHNKLTFNDQVSIQTEGQVNIIFNKNLEMCIMNKFMNT